MDMIGHQAVRQTLDGEPFGGLREELEVTQVVIVAAKNRLLVIASRGNVLHRTGLVKSKRSGHATDRARARPVTATSWKIEI
jgi:hypothetical protein